MELAIGIPRRIITLLLGTFLFFSGGCVDNDGPSLFVLGNGLFDDECMIDPENPELLLTGDFIVGLGTGYEVQPIFLNQLPNLASSIGRSDPNAIQVRGVAVTLTDASGAVIPFGADPNPFSVAMSALIPSAMEVSNPGRGVGRVTVIPPSYADALPGLIGAGSQNIVIRMEFFGETTGQNEVESSEFIWPVSVCSGNACPGVVCALSAAASCTPCQDGGGCPIAAIPPCQCLTAADCGGAACNMGICDTSP